MTCLPCIYIEGVQGDCLTPEPAERQAVTICGQRRPPPRKPPKPPPRKPPTPPPPNPRSAKPPPPKRPAHPPELKPPHRWVPRPRANDWLSSDDRKSDEDRPRQPSAACCCQPDELAR